MRRLAILTIVLLLIIAAIVAAGNPVREGRMKLLTFSEETGGGGTADIYLEIRPGSGSVFIDSFPLTRLDTQSSTRYANQVACELLEKNCRGYDFFYTIRADSSIVGGPSAGAAIAVLTAAVLDDEDLESDIAMTGTINSGGIIGPVAGIPEKVNGARAAGIRRVLVPAIAGTVCGNDSVDCTGPAGDIEVLQVRDVHEALEYFTGKSYRGERQPLTPPPEYLTLMGEVAGNICNRTVFLREAVLNSNLSYDDPSNYTERIPSAEDDYSRASLCFSANIELNTLLKREDSANDRREMRRSLLLSALEMERMVNGWNLSTITDLEIYAIVKERVLEAQQTLADANSSDADPYLLAYAEERLLSARIWSIFKQMPGKQVNLDDVYLQQACLAKMAEAEERISYVEIYSPALAVDAVGTLQESRVQASRDPILCIFSASKAKAQANIVASALAVTNETVSILLDAKFSAAETALQEQQSDGSFPVIGYSYLNYARNLRESSEFSALTFTEYSIELSDLGMYFPEENGLVVPPIVLQWLPVFLFGTLFGVALAGFLLAKAPERPARSKTGRNPPGKKR